MSKTITIEIFSQTERMPNDGEQVMVFTKFYQLEPFTWSDGAWFSSEGIDVDPETVRYWFYIPQIWTFEGWEF